MKRVITDFMAEVDRQTVGELLTDQFNRILYSTDASLYQVMPYGVLVPQTMDDVAAAVSIAAKYKVPILPRGGGSSLAGQATNEALVIDFTRHLNQVIELNVEESWVKVQPGLVLDNLNRLLVESGLQFGPDPASSNRAAIGGIVGNNSTGSHSIIYGMTADHLLAADVILSSGRSAHFGPLSADELRQRQALSGREGDIYQTLINIIGNGTNQAIIQEGTPSHWRRCGGYGLERLRPFDQYPIPQHPLWPLPPDFNAARLMAGSEGTLAVFKALTLNLVPKPKKTAVVILSFEDGLDALRAIPALLEVEPSAIELLDHLSLTMCREVPSFSRMLDLLFEGTPDSILITEFYGDSDSQLIAKMARLQRVVKQLDGLTATIPLTDKKRQSYIWQIRKAGLGLLMSVRSDFKPIPFIEDSAVPVEHLADYVSQIKAFCHALGTRIIFYAHASAGCLHIRPLINTKLGGEVDKLPRITRYAADLIRGYRGAFSSEHGDGKTRSWLNETFYGQPLYSLYQQVKHVFDPDNILNPGHIVDAPSMTDNLRFGASYQTIPLDPILDFSADGGFSPAVEMCNGAGACRKTTLQTMCPSFMVTLNERDSTRGRANLLRAALSGRLPPAELTGKGLAEAMDLCISCKACKAECPSSVDMAKIKAEWQSQYYAVNGTPLRARFFANVAPLSRLASGFLAPMVNFGLRRRVVQQLLAQTLGIGGQRPLPSFARHSFQSWFKTHKSGSDGRSGRVVLFADSLASYNYPEVAIAATRVLEAAGFDILLSGVTDSGRPALSKGLLKKAQRVAAQVIDHLYPMAKEGMPILFLEPSELSAVVDDYDALIPHDPRLALVKSSCHSFEAFMAEQMRSGKVSLPFKRVSGAILLHGHCHEKALFGTEAVHGLLHQVGEIDIFEVDSGCCGMAGAFGYETEHIEISLKMGERSLLPAVRAATADTIIVASGVSCRQQIFFGSGRQAVHPAQFLAACLRP